MCCGHSARLVVLYLSQMRLVQVSSMALARVTVKVSGVDCLVVEPVETPCYDLEAACFVAGPVEMTCRGW